MFNVEAATPVSNMRVRLGKSVIKADQDDLSITVNINSEQADEVIQLLVEDQVIYQTTLSQMID